MAIKVTVFSDENYEGNKEEFWESDKNVTHVRFPVASVKVHKGSWELVGSGYSDFYGDGDIGIKLSDSGGPDDDGGYPNLNSTDWNGPMSLKKILEIT
jgi:hypothetical protein